MPLSAVESRTVRREEQEEFEITAKTREKMVGC